MEASSSIFGSHVNLPPNGKLDVDWLQIMMNSGLRANLQILFLEGKF